MKGTGKLSLDIERFTTDELNHTRLAALDENGCRIGEFLVDYGEQEIDRESLLQALQEAEGIELEMPHGSLKFDDDPVVADTHKDGPISVFGKGIFEGRANCWEMGACGIGRFYGYIKTVETSAWGEPIPWVVYDTARFLAGEWLPYKTPERLKGVVKREIMKEVIEVLLSVKDRAFMNDILEELMEEQQVIAPRDC